MITKTLLGAGVLLAVAALFTAAHAGSDRPPGEAHRQAVVDRCRTNYASSSARQTCYGERFDATNGGAGRIRVMCWEAPEWAGMRSTVARSNMMVVPAEEASRLHNCDGRLRLGNC